MTDQVLPAGFTLPATPAPAATPAPNGTPVPIPAPGAVQGAAPAQPQAPAADTAPAPTSDLAAAIAALTAAFNKAAPAPAVEQPTGPAIPESIGTSQQDLNSVDVEGLDDPVLRSMAYAMQQGAPAGLDMNRVLGLAIERADATLIDRAYLVEKCGESAQHRIAIAEGIVAQAAAKANEVANAVYAAAGGKEQWGACAAAFNKGAPKELRAIVASMLDSGNTEYTAAASKIVVDFGKSNGLVPNVGTSVQAGAGVSPQNALSKSEFQAELRKLDPSSREYEQQRNDLFARRTMGARLGK